jgi:hypothetical protein
MTPNVSLTVSLPLEWIQEIKRMMTVYSIHGLYLTCRQRSCWYLHKIQILDITQCTVFLSNPLQNNKNPYLLGGLASCS